MAGVRRSSAGGCGALLTRTRSLALAVLALVTVAALAVGLAGPVWRVAYPYLPARAQALPYRLRAKLPGAHRTPVALPTPLAVAPGPSTLPAVPTAWIAPVAASAPATPTALAPATPTALAPATPTAMAPATPTAITPATPIAITPATPTATAFVPPASPALPAAATVAGVRHAYQRWNNCGPTTIAMALSAFGDTVDQMAAAQALKPDPDDKNVGPEELAAFARGRGYYAVARVNGDVDRLRQLVAAGVPVIVETWFVPEPGDEMGHYRLVTGYEEGGQQLRTADSYNGPNVVVSADELDRLWRVFNRTYVVAVAPAMAATVTQVLGADVDDGPMYTRAVARAEAELMVQADAFGWFNLASSLLGLGDTAGAAAAYDRSRALDLPWRMLWYQFGPFEAYAAEGRWGDVAGLAEANLRNAGNLEESLYWRGRAREAGGDVSGARADYSRALGLNRFFGPARAALDRSD